MRTRPSDPFVTPVGDAGTWERTVPAQTTPSSEEGGNRHDASDATRWEKPGDSCSVH